MWSMVATWPFSLQCVTKGAEILSQGGTALDAVEMGIHPVETDPAVDSVGRGGFMNADGELALDASVMDGDTLKMGVVACVRGYEHPVSIARKVMENTKHSILVGPSAERFAEEMGFEKADLDYLITPESRKAWETKKNEGHDTIGTVALDSHGSMAVGTSTSGANMRMPGRVGDTPIIGSGFYVESGVGGAAATGLGEDIMRTCCSFRAVELMRSGMSPQQAVDTVVRTAHEIIKKHGGKPDCIAMVCMNAAGEYAGAANHKGYGYARVRENGQAEVIMVTPVIDKDVE